MTPRVVTSILFERFKKQVVNVLDIIVLDDFVDLFLADLFHA
jgi:hypothetical protein